MSVEFIPGAGYAPLAARRPRAVAIPVWCHRRFPMAFDKAKVVRAAEKYLAQGKIPAAIKEYRQIVENDKDDFTALNMLGDLYARQDNKQEAAQCFIRIAEHYREEGFQSKAIAMYKKIDRLNPRSPEIANKLALLYETQGLIVDARAQYMIVAEAWLRDGQTRKALEIFRKVADLDPQNTEARIKLAQGYMREGLKTEAATAFAEAGAQFLARGKHERAVEAYTQSLDLHPRDYVALNGYLNSHIALGTPDEAAEVLERALSEKPEDIELLSMLVNAYIEAEDAPSAERVVIRLVTVESSNYMRFIGVAQLYLKAGKVDEAVRVLSSITEQLLSGREEARLMELLNEALARDPEHVEALRLLVRVYAWQRDDEKQRQTLERLVEAAEAAGLADVERSTLLQLAQFSPDQRYLERLQALGHAPEQKTEERQPEAEPTTEEIPSFESFAFVTEETTASAMGLPPTEEVAEFEFNTVAPPVAAPDPSSSFADLNEDANETAPPSSFQEYDFGGETKEAATAEAGESQDTLDERRQALLRQELDSVDFYLAQGYMDIAADTLEMLERQFGAHELIAARREKLNQPAPPPSVAQPTPPETVEFETFARYDVAEEAPPIEAEGVEVDEIFAEIEAAPQASQPPVSNETVAPEISTIKTRPGIDPGLAAIFDEFRTAAEEEESPSAEGDYETHYNLGTAYKEMELLDEAVKEFQSAAEMVSPKDGTPRYLQCCNMLGHCFMSKEMPRLAVMWFKKGLEAPGHTEDEYQALRYDLGTSYEQMGDLDRAIEVFSEVYGINISYRGVAEKLRELQTQKAVNSKS
ncbi:MAG TPA: tetratricopeptide repeat protein [Pyrinomonadaceae bacterium]|nr:tetratricopeptide repeat protein [Pyrinomonadaceae bacterium]